ncbi:HAD-IIB family hydrolase [Patescibacteria group bacterium]|nr:HAD-IIB family hydrolase [Patescibacteria group bacterium]
MNNPTRVKVAMFDVDGTLAKSKQPMDASGLGLLADLTRKMPVVIVGGGKKELFWRQVVRPIAKFRPDLENLRVMPTNGASLYIWNKHWSRKYELRLTKAEGRRIREAIKIALKRIGFESPGRRYGNLIEDRGAQITFSALGQSAPLPVKETWNRQSDIRPRLLKELRRLLPDLDSHIAGLTSIDITRRGIDKGYAVRRAQEHFHVKKSDMLFVGDAIFPGGNDYPAKKAGIPCLRVNGPEETKRIIRGLIGR